MNRINKKCPECETEMVAGDVLSSGQGLAYQAAEWLEHERKDGTLASLKPASNFRRKLVSYRCPECGLLKEYAL